MSDDPIEPLSQRICDLESRLEFQDQTIGQLNDELVAHQRTITELRRQLELIVKRLPQTDQLDHDPATEPPPPHY